jgi:hypothetical protein
VRGVADSNPKQALLFKMSNDNYRNVYKSDHLGAVDLEEFIEANKPLIFTIKEVKQEIGAKVAGKRGDFNIAYFVENIKPWVLNSGNAKILRSFAGKEATNSVSTWKNIPVELYVDYNVKFGSDVVSGVRIKPVKPTIKAKEKAFFTEAQFEKAKAANATIEIIEKAYQLTDEIKTKYLEYVGSAQ